MAYSTKRYEQMFMMHRQALHNLLELIPEEQADFKAFDEGMTVTHIADHLAGAAMTAVARLEGQNSERAEPAQDYATAKARLDDSTAAMQRALQAADDETLNTVVEAFGGRSMPVYALLDFLREHEIHHKGQLWSMARMMGIAPGSFVHVG